MTRHLDRPTGRHHAASYRWRDEGMGVVALHGFTGSGEDWGPVADALGAPVLAPDLLGHGASPAPEQTAAYRMPCVVDDCLRWCDGRRRWAVMGYSMGGRVALRLASRLGDRLAGLVLISASPGLEDPTARAARAVQDRQLADAIVSRGAEWFSERWAQHPIIRSQQTIEASIREPMQARRRANRPQGLAGSLRGMGQGAVTPVWHALDTLDAPVLWVTGEDDAHYTHIGERAVQRLAHGRHLVIPGVGHCTHLESPHHVLPALAAFVDEVRHEALQGDTGGADSSLDA